MTLRFGPGPVFGLECLASPRRWQMYAGRVLFVGLMLAGMWLIWSSLPEDELITNFNVLQNLGRRLVSILMMTQLLAVLLAAPAATAGSICVDKSRGVLHHVFVTDLSDREIVLGKLFGRLLPIFGMMACGAPVLMLLGLVGGVDFGVVLRGYAITTALAILACTLALTFSIWVKRPSQALPPTYALIGLWIVGDVMLLTVYGGFNAAPRAFVPPVILILECLNPFMAVSTSYAFDDNTAWISPLAYVGTCLGLSLLLGTFAIARLRKAVVGQESRGAKRQRADAPLRLIDYIPGPPLNRNPVLWREWHRKRPTKWTGRFWTLYAILATAASGFVLFGLYTEPNNPWLQWLAALVNGVGVSVGLLLLTVSATTALAEERDRGSLDVILTTSLSTASILRGKWLGTMAMIPRLAILPLWVSLGAAMITGRWLGPLAMLGLIVAYAAFITSLGLALATWIPRLGRAIATGIFLVILLNVGLVVARGTLMRDQPIAASTPQAARFTVVSGANPGAGTAMTVRFLPPDYERPDWDWLLLGIPFAGVSDATLWGARIGGANRSFWPGTDASRYVIYQNEGYSWALIWMGIYGGLALWLFFATVASFDRCLGRMTTHVRLDRPRRLDPARARPRHPAREPAV